MEFLFDYKGQHIANSMNDQLYSPQGDHIGYYVPSNEIYVDLKGYYLGQVPFAYRLLHCDIYHFEGICFGIHNDYGSIGNVGDIGEIGSMEKVEGFSDVTKNRLKQ